MLFVLAYVPFSYLMDTTYWSLYVSHPVYLVSPSPEELATVPHLSYQDYWQILEGAPWRSYEDLRFRVGMSYYEYLLTRYYLYPESTWIRRLVPDHGFLSLQGGFGIGPDSVRNDELYMYWPETYFGQMDAVAGASGLRLRIRYNLEDRYLVDSSVWGENQLAGATWYHERKTWVQASWFGRDLALSAGNVGPRLPGYLVSLRPRYTLHPEPFPLFPNDGLGLYARYKWFGFFGDSAGMAATWFGPPRLRAGFLRGDYLGGWAVGVLPLDAITITLEAFGGQHGSGAAYSVAYRAPGLHLFWLQRKCWGEAPWRYAPWADSTFFYALMSFYPFTLRAAMRGERGSITLQYELGGWAWAGLRHYHSPFFNSFQFYVYQVRGIYGAWEVVREGSVLSLGYDKSLGYDGSLRLRTYYSFLKASYFEDGGWSGYEGFFPGVDSRVELKGERVRATASLRYKGFFLRWMDGGRWDAGISKVFAF